MVVEIIIYFWYQRFKHKIRTYMKAQRETFKLVYTFLKTYVYLKKKKNCCIRDLYIQKQYISHFSSDNL